MIVTCQEVYEASKSDAILGTSDRKVFLQFLRRAVELAAFKANWKCWLAKMDICSDCCGVVTLPSIVGTVLQVNVGGGPTIFRAPNHEFHINGGGSGCGGWYGWFGNGGGWNRCGFSDDAGFSPVFQDPTEWSVVAAICEDPIDGNGSLEMIVEGETIDATLNIKNAITIPTTGPSTSGVRIPLLNNTANTDPALTYFRKITRVTKPVTRGYVKLIAFPVKQMALSVNIGYYAPNETNPIYRRIKVGSSCQWVRVSYRRASLAVKDDHDIVPLGSFEATLSLLKSVRLSDSNNVDASEAYLAKAVRLLTEVENIEGGATWQPVQIDPSWGNISIDYR